MPDPRWAMDPLSAGHWQILYDTGLCSNYGRVYFDGARWVGRWTVKNNKTDEAVSAAGSCTPQATREAAMDEVEALIADACERITQAHR